MPVERVGVSFEPELLEEFDKMIKGKGYANRSEAIRDLVRKALRDEKVKMGSGRMIGTITFIYDHHEGDVTSRLQHFQHHHLEEIASTTHVHVDEKMCLEVLIVRGEATRLKKLADSILAIKGVKNGELVMTDA